MKLELAEPPRRKKVFVQGYDRHANHVPSYSRRKPLNDSSLFSFKLADMAGNRIVNSIPAIVVPDPANLKAPRLVRLDMFSQLPDSEFLKIMNYVADFNDQEVIDEAFEARLSLNDPIPQRSGITATDVVNSVFQSDPNGTTVQTTSIWDEEFIPGIKNKYSAPVAALLIYKFIF
jgi:hypothetical protein